MKQTDKTKKFIERVEYLIDNGYVKNKTEIIKSLDWEKTMFSNVMNGRRNIPNDTYRKFAEVYPESMGVDDIIVPGTGDPGSEIGDVKTDVVTLHASINILLTTVSSISAAQRGKEFASVYAELRQAIKDEIRNLLAESAKR